MHDLLLVGVAFLIVYYGNQILGRLDALPRHKSDSKTTFELCDEWITMRADNIHEEEFKVEYIDDWQIGRVYQIGGEIISRDDEDDGSEEGPFGKRVDLAFGKYTTIQIFPMLGWYESSRLGQMLFSDGKAGMIYVGLPYQIAQTALDDLRRQPRQDVSIGIKKGEGKDGKVTYGVYSFALSEIFDDEQ